jgi:hypothetical protein
MIRTTSAALLFATVAALGCGNDHTGGDDGSNSFEPDPPQVYVAKVKNILVGLPPTDDEVAQVVADPNALGKLVDGWMALPQYQQKMQVFFELAFQQTQISDIDFIPLIPPKGIGNALGVPTLVQNASESFARTVLELQAEGRPLTEAFTTKRVMMTPALMEFYAFFDTYRVNIDDTGKTTVIDSFAKANPGAVITMQTAAGQPTFQQSITKGANFMHWYVPDLPKLKFANNPNCDGVDPITFPVDARDLHAMLYGEIPNHNLGGGLGNCNQRNSTAIGQLQPTDFTTWKMVTIRPPNSGEATTTFYDVPSMRTATELVLDTPHPGFFTTPAFFANWPTNSSNQMRVTLNQALIVATGNQIDGTDATNPGDNPPGVDTDHAAPGTQCYGCHQLLDPTRSILSSTYNYMYAPQTDQAMIAQKGLFAFQGVVQSMNSIDDFASLLASHPLVAAAWTQKLCYYVNSAACDPADPVFTTIATDFQSSNFNWNAVVKEVVTSAITTNVSETKTWDTNSEVIAVARRDHLCANLNNRLGLVDICGLDATLGKPGKPSVISQIVSGLPSDGYGRGSTIPVLPNQPTLFFRAGMENICAAVAAIVVDPQGQTGQTPLKTWTGSQPDAAIADFVSTIMGLPPSDARAAQATTILKSHFTSATGTGASATTALQSTFTVACLSPSFTGIGL